MKKYLSIICALLTLTAFASCGDNNSSSDSSEVPESSISETTTEEETEPTTEIKTEQETTAQKQVYDLDSDIEVDNVSLSIPSFLKISNSYEEKSYSYLNTSWNDDNGKYHNIIFYFYKDPEMYCNGGKAEGGKFEEDKVTDRFTINGNEYMVTHGIYIPTTIFFTNEVASGRIHYDDEDEELVKQIIETIKFNTEEVETTKESKNIDTKLTETCKIGEISFKIPDNCEVKDNDGNIVITFSDNSMIQFATMETTKEICSSADSDKEVLLDAILASFISSGNFEATSEYSKTDVKGFFAITQEATYSSLYNCTLYCFFSENNVYMLAFAKSQLLEAEEAYNLQHEIINSFEFESSDIEESITTEKEETTELKKATKATKPVTEVSTEKPVETQPPVVQTALHFVLNLETSCIHIDPDCSAALKILPENYSTVDIAKDDLGNYNGIYWACGKCSREYTGVLPKF